MDKRLLRQIIDGLASPDTDESSTNACVAYAERLAGKADARIERLLVQQRSAETLRDLCHAVSVPMSDDVRTGLAEYLTLWLNGSQDGASLPDSLNQLLAVPGNEAGETAGGFGPFESEKGEVADAADDFVVAGGDLADDESMSASAPSGATQPGAPIDSIETDPELLEAFAVETNEHLESIEALILDLEDGDGGETIDALFRAFHSIKGNSSFFGFSAIQNIAHEMETLLDKVRSGDLEFSRELRDLVLLVQSAMLDMTAEAFAEMRDTPAPPQVLAALTNFQGGEPPVAVVATPEPEETLSEPVAPSGSVPKTDSGTDVEQSKSRKAFKGNTGEVVRVEAHRLDFLVDLIGELVISYSIVSDSIAGLGTTSNRLQQGAKQLTAIIRDLQSLSTSLRMVPIRPVFQRMKRLVRDVSAHTGKPIDFEVIGEATQVDKSLVDEVGDPLVHLIRNAIDHGVEDEAGRRAALKPLEGRLKLSAAQRGSWIVVEIEDDGKGLDTDRIRQKAIDKGLINEDVELPVERIHELILHPGFSTAQTVSEVSGRGVGMDVVKRSVEALRGTLDIRSEPGRGTCFTLRFPLTLAIIDGVVAKIGSEHYIIPGSSVVQTVRHGGRPLSSVGGEGEVVVYRDEAIPLIRLCELFDVPDALPPSEDSLLMVLDSDNRRFA
ncbi:MAG: chemotaxis protein CheA, partial [Pseudomonadota bacterium]